MDPDTMFIHAVITVPADMAGVRFSITKTLRFPSSASLLAAVLPAIPLPTIMLSYILLSSGRCAPLSFVYYTHSCF